MAIPLQRYTFHGRWTSEARLPEYLGSALRGAFGWALKKSSCALIDQECATCILRQRCAYAWVFETERYTDSADGNVNARPHPFVLQPGANTAGTQQAGTPWEFSLLLIGQGIDFLPHIVYSVQQMSEAGIGAATRQVHLLYYLMFDDPVGEAVTSALCAAAARGVTCRVLLDAVGAKRGLHAYRARLRAAGVMVHYMLPGGLRWRRSGRMDLRNHR